MASCGVGPARLLGPISALTLLLAAAVAWLSLIRTPDASRQIEEIKFQAREELEIGVLESGVFTSPDSGDTTVYAQRVSGDEIYDVFIEHKDGDRVIVIRAERGERRQDADDGHLTFVLYNGRRYEGVPGEPSFRIVEFGEHGMPVRIDPSEEEELPVQTKPVAALLSSTQPEDRAELQWRLSAPVSLFVLALVAVPLSRSSPREGRYARLGIGILVYIIYANMMTIARTMVERDEVPQWLGMWWVHAILAVLGLTLLARESGWFARVTEAQA